MMHGQKKHQVIVISDYFFPWKTDQTWCYK